MATTVVTVTANGNVSAKMTKPGASGKKPIRHRGGMIRRPATARLNKLRAYKTKSPGGKPVTYIDSNGVTKTRPRRYTGRVQLKRRHKFYTTNKKGQQGSSLVQARVNTFIRQQVTRITEDMADAGTHWDNVRDANGKLKVHFQCTDEFNNAMGIHMASLHDAIYEDAAERARKREPDYRGQAPIQAHGWHVEAAWKQRLRVASGGRRSRPKTISVDTSVPMRTDANGNPVLDKDGNQVLSRARYLSTEEQRKAIKGVYNIGRVKPDVNPIVDGIVKQEASEAIRLAMIYRFNQTHNVQLTFGDAKRAIEALGTFPATISGL